MNRAERRAFERSRNKRVAKIKQDVKQARERDGRYRYMIFLNNVPAWPDTFITEKEADIVMGKLKGAMAADNPDDERLDSFEVRPVLPSKPDDVH